MIATTKRGLIAGFCVMVGMTALALPSYADALDDILANKKIRIAVDLALPPYGMIDEKMKPTGSDVLVAEKIAEDFGVELEIVPTTAASRIPSLQTNKADLVISTLSITPERAEVIDFSPPYAPLRTVLAGSKKVEAASFDDLAGKDVGTSRGTMHDAYVTKMATGANIKRYEDDATMVQAYSAGQVEFFTAAENLLKSIGEKNPNNPPETKIVMETFRLAIGVKKGETALLDKVSDWVRTNLDNGELNTIFKEFHGIDLPPEITEASAE